MCQKGQPQWSSYFRVLTGQSVAKVTWQSLGGRIANILLATCWPGAFKIPHANRKRPEISKKRVCDFLFWGVVLPHYSYAFCMVKSWMQGRCVGVIFKLFLDLPKSPPQWSSWIRVVSGQSVAKVTWQGLGGRLANIWLATCWPGAFTIPDAKQKKARNFKKGSATLCFEV